MPGLHSGDVDSVVRVVVTPSQSSYFAGEPFTVIITFTNTRSPDSGPSKPSFHKRGAHSISSAPLARPPTSPGTPRTVATTTLTRSKSGDGALIRKGLIGIRRLLKDADEWPELIEQRRKRLLAKSLSVTIASHDFEDQLGEGVILRSASCAQQSFSGVLQSPSPRISSPLARSDTLPLASNHPHARKQSVFDGQSSLDTMMFPVTSTSPPALYPHTPNSSASTFSLVLDPIAESTLSPYPPTPTTTSPSIPTQASLILASTDTTRADSVYAYPPPRHTRRQPQIGLGHPPNSLKLTTQVPPRSAFSSSFPESSTELILYSYAQLKGTLFIIPVPGTQATAEQMHTLNGLRAALLKRSVVGGGSMDITSSLNLQQPPAHRRHRPTHSRSSSFSSGFLSILSPSSLVASASAPPGSPAAWSPSHWPRSSPGFSPFPSPASGKIPSPGPMGLNIAGSVEEEVDPEAPLPTFEVQPAMLGVDLSLSPGESRSYTYSILLPDNLPPTFKGRSLQFSYELVIGTCRAGPSSGGLGSRSASSVSRVMKVPIRVYNHVIVGAPPRPYDLLWPVSKPLRTAESQGKAVEETGNIVKRLGRVPAVPSPLATSGTGGTLNDLQDYARRLLASFPEPGLSGVRIKLPAEGASPILQGHSEGGTWEEVERERRAETERRKEREREREEEGALTGCREAVEILTRNPKKISYDVNKDGVKVAVLTFAKSAYRLGETVLGVVELNETTSRARVLQLSAILEAHESLPESISPPSSSRHLRRVHAEHHSSFVLSTLRTTFSLDIPSDASPAFQVRAGMDYPGAPHTAAGGLEWKVRLCLLVAVAAESSHLGTEGVRIKSLVRDGPRGEWGSSWRATEDIAPLEKPVKSPPQPQPQNTTQSWAAFIASSFLGSSERGYHDGDEVDETEEEEGLYDGVKADQAGGVGVGVNFGGGEEGWREVNLETVECEVPIKVWPGNTAFKALDIVFDV